MSRYSTLLDIVRDIKPEHVVEIGTWNGRRAIEMMAVSNCYYTGFDLFEDASEETDKTEFNVKSHSEMNEVAKAIEAAGFSKFCLIRGNTHETLENHNIEPFDFAFIDGGHSIETIRNDFKWVKKNISKGGTIILDDYYDPAVVGMGCNFLHESFQHTTQLINGSDRLAGGGTVSFLKVVV